MKTSVALAALLACTPAADAVELIADPSFARGLRVFDRQTNEHRIAWGAATNAPVWEVRQHHSRSCAAETNFHAFRPDGFTFRDDYALLAIHPPDVDADLVAGLNAFREYGGVYRARGDAWPHLYLSQRIGNPAGHLGERSPPVTEMARLDFAISVRLLQDRRNLNAGHDPHLHAGQFVFFLTIQNLTRKSPGYGDYYHFGISLYDDRKPLTALLAMHDKSSAKKRGTEKLIYDVGVKPFTDEVVASGRWVDLRGDLLPHIHAGLDEAWKRGYLAGSTNRADYRVSSVVFGWEIPGLNDAAIAVRNLRATAVPRQ